MHASTEVNMPRASNNLEVVNRPSIKVKGFTPNANGLHIP
jgi:hypothetical protein